MGPVHQVVGFHQNERAVVAPVVHVFGALPVIGPQSFPLGKDMKVRHRHVKRIVRTAHDVNVADTLLLGDVTAVHDRLAVVEGGERIAVAAQSHVKAVGFIGKINQEIGRQIFFVGERRRPGRG